MAIDPAGDTRATTRRALLVGGLSLAVMGVRPGAAGALPPVVVHRDPT